MIKIKWHPEPISELAIPSLNVYMQFPSPSPTRMGSHCPWCILQTGAHKHLHICVLPRNLPHQPFIVKLTAVTTCCLHFWQTRKAGVG